MARSFIVGQSDIYESEDNIFLISSNPEVVSINGATYTGTSKGSASIIVKDNESNIVDKFLVLVTKSEEERGSRFGIGNMKHLRPVRKLTRLLNGNPIKTTIKF